MDLHGLPVFHLADANEARGNSVTVREVLDQAVSRIDRTEFSRAEIRARFLATMGQAYSSLGLNKRGAELLRLSIAGLVLIYVCSGILKDPSGTGQVMASRPVSPAFRISTNSGLSPTVIGIALVVGIAMWILVNRTAFGVLSSLAGRNPIMVVWQGAKLSRLGIAGFVLGGALAGLAGTIEVLGPNGRLVSGFLPAHGFTAILIALVASLSITGTAVVSLFFGGLAAASLYLPVLAGLPSAAIDIINAAIALFITARTVPGLARLAARRRASGST